MKRLIKIMAGLVVFGVLCVSLTTAKIYRQELEQETEKKIQEIKREEEVKGIIEVEKTKYDYEAVCEKIEKYLNNEIKIILLSEYGEFRISHDKTPENHWWSEWLNNSSVELILEYKVIISIPANSIWAETTDNGVKIKYFWQDIYIEAVEILNMAPITDKSLFGKPYSPEQITALTLIARDKIIDEIKSERTLFTKAEANLIIKLPEKVREFTGKFFPITRVNDYSFLYE